MQNSCLQKNQHIVGRGNAIHARSKGLSQSFEKDMISELPDPLICQILDHLPTKEAVKTSVLSTRWRSLWLWVPNLELFSLNFSDFNTFLSFGDRFFDSSRVSRMHKLDLTIGENNDVFEDDYVYYGAYPSWIDAVVNRKIQHLDVRYLLADYLYAIPSSLYTCETLVTLKLFKVALDSAEFVSLPCLKTMHLNHNLYPNESTFERLVSSCPVLEELEIATSATANENTLVFRVLSKSLKRLYSFGSRLVVDSPQLRFLRIVNTISESLVINKMHSDVKLEIFITSASLWGFDEEDVSSMTNNIRNFLHGISMVMDMKISADTIKLISGYLKPESLPQFSYMTRLHVTLSYSYLKWLPTFLETCPNLKSLILVTGSVYSEIPVEQMNEIDFSTVPECLTSSLEFFYIKSSISGHDAEMMLLRFFLENSKVLKKLTLISTNYSRKENSILMELLRIPRGSPKCEVVVLRELERT